MKPAPFDYFAPDTVEEALALLAEHGDEAKVLAGGQSLIPTMSFRLAQPAVLVDLRRLAELTRITPADDGGVLVGAMVRQRQVERSEVVAERVPLVAETLPYIAHPQIRNQGTFGGSIAHADPAAELPAVAVALGTRMHIRGSSGEERTVDATDFFVGLFETAVGATDLLTAVELPSLPPRTGWAFDEVARRHGDYALLGAAAVLGLDGGGRIDRAEIVFLSAGEKPVQATKAVEGLVGEVPSEELFRAAAETAASADIDPPADIHASKPYRRQLARVLTRRILARASARVSPSEAC